jgi:segregation and condensation protein B
MDKEQVLKIIEALLYMTDHPLSFKEINEVIEERNWPEPKIKELVDELTQKWASPTSPLQIVQVAGGVQMATKQEMAPYIRKLYKERLTVRLSPSALETLSIIAYKQPIARSEIEQIRGVEVTGVIETLLERRLIKVVGRKETIGRPLLYGTTTDFLRQFGLNHLTDLPDLESMMPQQKEPQLLINVNKASTDEMNLDQPAEGEIRGNEPELATVEAASGPEHFPESNSESIENS